jgi:predicted nucleotidyltransferase
MDTQADDVQIGGAHYKDMGMQPWAVMEVVLTREEFIGFLKGNVIKYSMRQGKKVDSDDVNKARHYAAKLKEVLGTP